MDNLLFIFDVVCCMKSMLFAIVNYSTAASILYIVFNILH